jgi:GT2 family glycosyltransferase
MAIDVSVVVVTWRSAATIAACLASAREASPAEIIVVDNASNDGTLSVVAEQFPEVVLIQTGANLGYSAACNAGMRRARSGAVLLLNPDAVLEPGAVSRLVEFLSATADAAAVSPLVVDSKGEVLMFTARELPQLRVVLFRQLGLAKLFPKSRFFCSDLPLIRSIAEPQSVPYLCGAVVLVRRSFLDEYGLLDDSIPMYLDDLEFSARVVRSGFKNYIVPQARAQHIGGHSASLSPARGLLHMLEDGQAPWMYFREYRGTIAAAVFRVIVLVASMLRVVGLSAAQLIAQTPDRKHWAGAQKRKAIALLEWSMMSNRVLDRRIYTKFARSQQSARKAVGSWD